MTVTVTVKARAHGATLTVDGQELRVEANREQQFQVEPGTPLSLTVNEPAEAPAEPSPLPLDPDNVPGRAENDALLGNKPDEEKPPEGDKPDRGGKRPLGS